MADIEVYCVCRKTYEQDDSDMVACTRCEQWFHLHCMKLRRAPQGNWYCIKCVLTKGKDWSGVQQLLHSKFRLDRPCARHGCSCLVEKERASKYCNDSCARQAGFDTLRMVMPRIAASSANALDPGVKASLALVTAAKQKSIQELSDLLAEVQELTARVQAFDKYIAKLSPDNHTAFQRLLESKANAMPAPETTTEAEAISIDCSVCGTQLTLAQWRTHSAKCFKNVEGSVAISVEDPIDTDPSCEIKAYCNHRSREGTFCNRLDALCLQHGEKGRANFSRPAQAMCGYFEPTVSPSDSRLLAGELLICTRPVQGCAYHHRWLYFRYGWLCQRLVNKCYSVSCVKADLRQFEEQRAMHLLGVLHALGTCVLPSAREVQEAAAKRSKLVADMAHNPTPAQDANLWRAVRAQEHDPKTAESEERPKYTVGMRKLAQQGSLTLSS
eukprot:m.190210 g.190210  ORF g.190210 m.190210 type:complete len:442 (-) comp14810_c1_seq1:48-1373(-)